MACACLRMALGLAPGLHGALTPGLNGDRRSLRATAEKRWVRLRWALPWVVVAKIHTDTSTDSWRIRSRGMGTDPFSAEVTCRQVPLPLKCSLRTTGSDGIILATIYVYVVYVAQRILVRSLLLIHHACHDSTTDVAHQ